MRINDAKYTTIIVTMSRIYKTTVHLNILSNTVKQSQTCFLTGKRLK
jgi:hypothetical protein